MDHIKLMWVASVAHTIIPPIMVLIILCNHGTRLSGGMPVCYSETGMFDILTEYCRLSTMMGGN